MEQVLQPAISLLGENIYIEDDTGNKASRLPGADCPLSDIWPKDFNFFLLHGWMLWGAWTVFALVQVVSNRYLKGTLFGANMWIHRIVGALVLLITGFFGFYAWEQFGWTYADSIHVYFVFPVLYGVLLVVLLGVGSRIAKRRCRWNTKSALYLTRIHKIIAYLLMLAGFIGIFTGVQDYRGWHPEITVPLEWLHLFITLGLFGLMEIIYICLQSKEYHFTLREQYENQIITYEQFSSQVKQGAKLVILDGYVVDVRRFLDEHPGGRFSIELNIGRDISKYFHGGYALENSAQMPPVTHSSDARRLVSKLIIGKLDNLSCTNVMSVAKVQRDANEAGNVKVIQFETVSTDSQQNGQRRPTCSLLDIKQIGKHYLVKTTSLRSKIWFQASTPTSIGDFNKEIPGIKRQYTEAFCMRKQVYEALIKLVNGDQQAFNLELLKNELHEQMGKNNNENLCLTIKNYDQFNGLSKYVHGSVGQGKVLIEGPIGTGLGIKNSGRHIAFAAGTGILPFIDLVAHLILRLIGFQANYTEPQIDIDNFQFILYTSYRTSKDAIGLRLIQCLLELCQKQGRRDLFIHYSRISQEKSNAGDANIAMKSAEDRQALMSKIQDDNSAGSTSMGLATGVGTTAGSYGTQMQKQRWDQKFFRDKLLEYGKKGISTQNEIIKKIWICGPPVMQETLEKAAEELQDMFSDSDIIHIL